jgi:hypothetical protein
MPVDVLIAARPLGPQAIRSQQKRVFYDLESWHHKRNDVNCLMLKLSHAQTPQRSIREVNVIIEGDPWISQDANKLYLHQIYYQDSIGRIVV